MMANPRAPLTRLATLLAPPSPSVSCIAALPYRTIRCATTKAQPAKKKKASNMYKQYDLKHAEQFSLLDAMHYLRAFEVGRNPSSSKYEVHVRLRSLKNGPAIRNRLRLPHPVKNDVRICVIAPPDSTAAADARAAGAVLVGEDDVFAQIKEGKIEFDRCLCHVDSLQKMNKAAVGRILGPKGLMPSMKTGTVVTNVAKTVSDMASGSEYRERLGVIRMAVGQLGFTPDELQKNLKTMMDSVKREISQLQGRAISKEIHEVVLSSTNGPGFTLNGELRGPNSVAAEELSGPL